MISTDSITKIAPALVAAAGQLSAVAKDSVNPAFRSKYVSLDALMAEVRPVLAQHGLCVMQGTKYPETAEQGKLVGITIETRIIHSSGEWIASSVVVPVAKSDPQGAGSAITYGRRYGLSAALGLTADDDDGESATQATRNATYKQDRQQDRKAAPVADAPAAQRMFDAVPTTPRAKAFDGNVAEAMAYPFPFKKSAHHGKPLGEVPEDALISTLKWCQDTDAAKFADLIARMEAVIHHGNSMQQESDDAAANDDLPF
jgi:hypothetical protein